MRKVTITASGETTIGVHASFTVAVPDDVTGEELEALVDTVKSDVEWEERGAGTGGCGAEERAG